MKKIIDVHTHFSIETSAFAEDADKIGFRVENKTIDEFLAAKAELGIAYSVLSCPTQKFMDDAQKCADYCRLVNETAAEYVKKYPSQLAFAAALPLPYVESSLEETRYAVEVLGAKSINLCSNYAGMYLGDSRLEPLFDLIDTYGIPIILHPAAPLDYPKNPITGKILPMYEFITDTTRTVLDLFASETLLRHPNVNLIIPHTGSCVPAAIDRFQGILRVQGKQVDLPMDQLYFDLACDAFPNAVKILLTMTDPTHIMYGSDYPAIPVPVLKKHLSDALHCPELQAYQEQVMHMTAEKLFRL